MAGADIGQYWAGGTMGMQTSLVQALLRPRGGFTARAR